MISLKEARRLYEAVSEKFLTALNPNEPAIVGKDFEKLHHIDWYFRKIRGPVQARRVQAVRERNLRGRDG